VHIAGCHIVTQSRVNTLHEQVEVQAFLIRRLAVALHKGGFWSIARSKAGSQGGLFNGALSYANILAALIFF
jgi:hypothetical protein